MVYFLGTGYKEQTDPDVLLANTHSRQQTNKWSYRPQDNVLGSGSSQPFPVSSKYLINISATQHVTLSPQMTLHDSLSEEIT